MTTRTVRLDDDAEAALEEIRRATGLPISEALKRGLRSLQEQVKHETNRTPYDIFRQLDLGPGGYATAPSTRTRRGVAQAIRKKLKPSIGKTSRRIESVEAIATIQWKSCRDAPDAIIASPCATPACCGRPRFAASQAALSRSRTFPRDRSRRGPSRPWVLFRSAPGPCPPVR